MIPPITDVTFLGPDNDVLIAETPSLSNSTITATLIVDNITMQSFGEYVCVIRNAAGVNATSVRLRERGIDEWLLTYYI